MLWTEDITQVLKKFTKIILVILLLIADSVIFLKSIPLNVNIFFKTTTMLNRLTKSYLIRLTNFNYIHIYFNNIINVRLNSAKHLIYNILILTQIFLNRSWVMRSILLLPISNNSVTKTIIFLKEIKQYPIYACGAFISKYPPPPHSFF